MSIDDFDSGLIATLQNVERIVVLTGAGVSSESGIPTFRDELTGFWATYSYEELATSEAFHKDSALVWGWYEWRRQMILAAKPNPAHVAIAELALCIPEFSLFTQNVDDLHERAGSQDVQHLHGSIHHPRCIKCGVSFLLPDAPPGDPEQWKRLPPPVCLVCGESIRPGVVWFNEQLPELIVRKAFESATLCDLFIVVGTSGMVWPARELPRAASSAGAKVLQINTAETEIDDVCTWSLRGQAGVVLPALLDCAF